MDTHLKYAEKEPPEIDIIATYVDTLKLFRQQSHNIPEEYTKLIDILPSPRKIRQDISYQEAKILFETVAYLWRKLTGNDFKKQINTHVSELPYLGNYWIIKNGLILTGPNHYTIIKQNENIICPILNTNAFALQHYLAGAPNPLIFFILKNGGVRMFARKDKKAFFQMTGQTYADWAKEKIKNMDFRERIIKIVDLKVPYTGWNSGIPIKIL